MKVWHMIVAIIFISVKSYALIDLDIISTIESSNNPLAYNKSSKDIGLYQISPICLKDFNNMTKSAITSNQLFNAQINERVARWYLFVRIPQMLRYYKKPVNIPNILISYNAGISYVAHAQPIPELTQNYINKYYALM